MSEQFVVLGRTTGKPITRRVGHTLAREIAARLDGTVVPEALSIRIWQPAPARADAWNVTLIDARSVGYLQAEFDRGWAAELFARTLAGQLRADGAIDVTVERQDRSGSEPMLSSSPEASPGRA